MRMSDKFQIVSLRDACISFLLPAAAGRPILAVRIAEDHCIPELYQEASRYLVCSIFRSLSSSGLIAAYVARQLHFVVASRVVDPLRANAPQTRTKAKLVSLSTAQARRLPRRTAGLQLSLRFFSLRLPRRGEMEIRLVRRLAIRGAASFHRLSFATRTRAISLFSGAVVGENAVPGGGEVVLCGSV